MAVATADVRQHGPESARRGRPPASLATLRLGPAPPGVRGSCGSGEPGTFRRNGPYKRRLCTLAGVITLHVPRLRCRCGCGHGLNRSTSSVLFRKVRQ